MQISLSGVNDNSGSQSVAPQPALLTSNTVLLNQKFQVWGPTLCVLTTFQVILMHTEV